MVLETTFLKVLILVGHHYNILFQEAFNYAFMILILLKIAMHGVGVCVCATVVKVE